MKAVVKYLSKCYSSDKEGDCDGISITMIRKEKSKNRFHDRKNSLKSVIQNENDSKITRWEEKSPTTIKLIGVDNQSLYQKPSLIVLTMVPNSNSKINFHDVEPQQEDEGGTQEVGVFTRKLLHTPTITPNDIKSIFT